MARIILGLMLVGVVLTQNYLEEEGFAMTTCPCGWGDKGRIVGGTETKENAYPYMAGLAFSTSRIPFCGASIITRKHAITAAHCTADIKNRIRSLRLLVGAHNVSKVDGLYIPVIRTIEHPNYEAENNVANDIAIVELDRLLTFRNDIGPVCLPKTRVNWENHYLLVTGWGLTTHEGQSSRVLRQVYLRVIAWLSCLRYYPGQLQRSRSQICTYERRKDSCQGDSGGPLTDLDSDTSLYFLAALVSFGRGCASETPGVNTDVSFYLNWINGVIAETSNGTLETCTKV